MSRRGCAPDQREAKAATDEPAWKRRLFAHDRRAIRATPGNALTLLEEAPEFTGLFAHNALRFEDVLLREPPWGQGGRYPRPITDADTDYLQRYIEETYGAVFSTTTLERMMSTVARQTILDPLRDYLEGLAWDGVPRLETMLPRLMGADDCTFTREVGRRWMVSAVARALDPGVKVDYALILYGAQGVAKSTALRILGGAWFTDHMPNVDTKDAAIQLQGAWIIELSELASLRGVAMEAIKGFITRSTDRFRPPYGRRTVEVPRRCVFAGTTNHNVFLSDPTGNRRWWPIRVERCDVEALRAERDQLWAEAVHRWRAGEAFHFEAHEMALMNEALEAQMAVTEMDPWEAKLGPWLEQLAETTSRDVLRRIGISDRDMTRSHEMRAANMLQARGFQRRQRRVDGRREYVYVRVS